MTNATTPIEAAFEMQRHSLKHGEELFKDSLDIQQNGAETFLENSLAVQRDAQRQGVELAQQLFKAQFEAFSSTFDDAVRSAVNRQLDEGADLTQQLLNAQFEQGADLIEQLVNGQLDMFLSVSDDAVRSAITRQFEEFNAFQSDNWDAFEANVSEAVDDLSSQQREIAAQTVQAILSAQREMEEQAIESAQ